MIFLIFNVTPSWKRFDIKIYLKIVLFLPGKRSFENISLSKSKKLLLKSKISFVSYGGKYQKFSSSIRKIRFLLRKELFAKRIQRETREETKANQIRSPLKEREKEREMISREVSLLWEAEMFIRCGNPYVDQLPENLISATRRKGRKTRVSIRSDLLALSPSF